MRKFPVEAFMPRGLVCLPLALFAAVTAAPVPKAKPVESYFPTAVGTKWVYEWQNGKLIMEEVIEMTEKNGERRVPVRSSEPGSNWDCMFSVTVKEVVQRTAIQFKVDFLLMRLPLKEQNSWEFEIPIQQRFKCDAGKMTVGMAEKIEVPAGTFEAVPVVSETTAVNGKAIPTPEKCTRWWVAGVGLVKIEYADGYRVLKESAPANK